VSSYAVSVENLGKKYLIAHRERDKYPTFKDVMTNSVRSLGRVLRRPLTKGANWSTEELWALSDVSFQVNEGERVGIIGRNGAGKSTLLRILSRVTDPTEGRICIKGRVGSLLEVGTGFHPELTGRENIYLNGAILGMSKSEIERKFDEIVTFSEVEKFLDTPVKRYSSGMYVRLAFAVAAHLEPEILVVDEVLAVGDAAFQKKCLGKMENAATREGRTVLFVSHNMAAIQSLCQTALWLDAGKVIDQGISKQVTQRYIQSTIPDRHISLEHRQDRSGDGSIRLMSLRIESADDSQFIHPGSRLKMTIGYRSETQVLYPRFEISIYDYESSLRILLLNSGEIHGLPESLPPQGSVTCITDPINLTPGRCFVSLRVKRGPGVADSVEFANFFDVEEADVYGTGRCPPRNDALTVIKHEWVTG
jgi:lipopolysaccharide transport system ATP-binding protein